MALVALGLNVVEPGNVRVGLLSQVVVKILVVHDAAHPFLHVPTIPEVIKVNRFGRRGSVGPRLLLSGIDIIWLFPLLVLDLVLDPLPLVSGGDEEVEAGRPAQDKGEDGISESKVVHVSELGLFIMAKLP